MDNSEITKEDIEKFVRKTICNHGTSAPDDPAELNLNETLKDLGIDSLDSVEIVMAAEDEYDIDIPDEEAEKFSDLEKNTSQDFINYLEGKLLK